MAWTWLALLTCLYQIGERGRNTVAFMALSYWTKAGWMQSLGKVSGIRNFGKDDVNVSSREESM